MDDLLQQCLKTACQYDDLSIEETVEEAFIMYKTITGHAFEVEDDEEGEAVVKSCFEYVADEVLQSLILKGVMEFSGMDENGEMWYSLTEEYRNGNFDS